MMGCLCRPPKQRVITVRVLSGLTLGVFIPFVVLYRWHDRSDQQAEGDGVNNLYVNYQKRESAYVGIITSNQTLDRARASAETWGKMAAKVELLITSTGGVTRRDTTVTLTTGLPRDRVRLIAHLRQSLVKVCTYHMGTFRWYVIIPDTTYVDLPRLRRHLAGRHHQRIMVGHSEEIAGKQCSPVDGVVISEALMTALCKDPWTCLTGSDHQEYEEDGIIGCISRHFSAACGKSVSTEMKRLNVTEQTTKSKGEGESQLLVQRLLEDQVRQTADRYIQLIRKLRNQEKTSAFGSLRRPASEREKRSRSQEWVIVDEGKVLSACHTGHSQAMAPVLTSNIPNIYQMSTLYADNQLRYHKPFSWSMLGAYINERGKGVTFTLALEQREKHGVYVARINSVQEVQYSVNRVLYPKPNVKWLILIANSMTRSCLFFRNWWKKISSFIWQTTSVLLVVQESHGHMLNCTSRWLDESHGDVIYLGSRAERRNEVRLAVNYIQNNYGSAVVYFQCATAQPSSDDIHACFTVGAFGLEQATDLSGSACDRGKPRCLSVSSSHRAHVV